MLKQRGRSVTALDKDFCDGVNLCHLLELVTGQSVPGFPSKKSSTENVALALDFLANTVGFKSYGINVQDIEVRICGPPRRGRWPGSGAHAHAASGARMHAPCTLPVVQNGDKRVLLGLIFQLVNKYQVLAALASGEGTHDHQCANEAEGYDARLD